MNPSHSILTASLATLFAACTWNVAPPPTTEPAPDLVQRAKERTRLDAKRRDFQAVLMRLDQAMDSYVTALSNGGNQRADAQIEKLGKLLHDTVLDNGSGQRTSNANPNNRNPGENFRRLQAQAADGTMPDKQATALAALGFSGRRDVMPLIVQGAMLSDPFVVDRAVLGLAVLRAPNTPLGVLTTIIENEKHPEDGRVQAAWALYQIQTVSTDYAEATKVWCRLLSTEHSRLPPGVIVTAIRGLGLTGEKTHAALVAPMLKQPTPRIRMAAALALGRMNAQEHWKGLLELLRPQESVQNVRLHARKALARLAGNNDYGYDVAAWQKVFDRGQKQL